MTTTSSDNAGTSPTTVIECELHCAPLEHSPLDMQLNRWLSYPPICLRQDHVAWGRIKREFLQLARVREAQTLDQSRIMASPASLEEKQRHLKSWTKTSGELARLCQRLHQYHGVN